MYSHPPGHLDHRRPNLHRHLPLAGEHRACTVHRPTHTPCSSVTDYFTILQIKYPNLYSEIALATGFTDASSEEQPFLGKSGDSFNCNFSYLFSNWGYFGLGLWAGGCSILFIAVGTVLKNRAYTRAAAATAERLRQADPALIQLLEKAGASHCILGLMEQKLTVAILTSFKDQPVLLRAELKDAGVKTAGDRLAIISTIVGVGSNHTTGASVGFP